MCSAEMDKEPMATFNALQLPVVLVIFVYRCCWLLWPWFWLQVATDAAVELVWVAADTVVVLVQAVAYLYCV